MIVERNDYADSLSTNNTIDNTKQSVKIRDYISGAGLVGLFPNHCSFPTHYIFHTYQFKPIITYENAFLLE